MTTKPQMQNEPTPPFHQKRIKRPGLESEMSEAPKYKAPLYKAAGKLIGKKALITGGDSGIGRAVAVLFAREGASIAITYLPEEQTDAEETRIEVEEEGSTCIIIPGDLTKESFCKKAIEKTLSDLGGIDILVSNAAHQMRKNDISEITTEEFEKTFRTNIFAYFHLAKAAVPHMKPGSCIIATTSETATRAPKDLLDYASTKGAIDTFTKSLAQMLIPKGIRVNAVAPGPVWTPLNPSDAGASQKRIKEFGKQSPMERPAQPEEMAPAYVFLASDADSSYINGAIIPAMGGKPI